MFVLNKCFAGATLIYFFELHVKNFELQLNANTLYSKTMDASSTWSTSIKESELTKHSVEKKA